MTATTTDHIRAGNTDYVRAYTSCHTVAHLIARGEQASLCGSRPREGRAWLTDSVRLAELPTCVRCSHQARFRAEIAAWDGPAPRTGVVAMVARSAGVRCAAAECARCGKLRMLPCRGLCRGCLKVTTKNGTIREYGWTKADRMAEYARCRSGGLHLREAAERTGVDERTAWRYETEHVKAGTATWRSA